VLGSHVAHAARVLEQIKPRLGQSSTVCHIGPELLVTQCSRT